MKLEIIDKSTRLKVEMIRTYEYAQYTDELVGEGTFKINLPVSDVSIPYLVRGNYIVFEEGIVGIINSVKDLQDDDMQIVVSGKLTNSILSIRSILRTERYSGNLSEISRNLITNNFIEPEDPNRKVSIISLSEDKKYIPTSESITFCDTGNTIRKSIATTFSPHGYGFELYPILDNYDEESGVIHNLSSLEFRVIKPVDRTINNKDGNTPVVFAFQLSNLSRLEYEEDGSSYCSIAVVASDGVGQDRRILEVGTTELSDLDRVELYVDARDIISTDENGQELPEEDIQSLMSQRGLEKLEGHRVFTSFDGSVILSGNNRYVYGEDFYKGDYVSIVDEKFNRVFDLQITSVTKSISQGVEFFDIGFGIDKMSTKKLINTSTGNSYGGSSVSSEYVESIATSLGGFSFGYTEDGKPGFIEAGADTVIPFSSGGSGGSGRTISFSSFFGEGYVFYPTAVSFADKSSDTPYRINRQQRTISFVETTL